MIELIRLQQVPRIDFRCYVCTMLGRLRVAHQFNLWFWQDLKRLQLEFVRLLSIVFVRFVWLKKWLIVQVTCGYSGIVKMTNGIHEGVWIESKQLCEHNCPYIKSIHLQKAFLIPSWAIDPSWTVRDECPAMPTPCRAHKTIEKKSYKERLTQSSFSYASICVSE